MKKQINSLQGARAIAVLLVVFIHSFTTEKSFLSNFYQLSTWGAIGVDLFFVISGFIMAIILPNYESESRQVKFIQKRLIRILPMYWIVSVAIALVNIKNHMLTLPSLIKSTLMIPLFDRKEIVFGLIPQGWTLGYELYFYLIIFGILATNTKRKLTVVSTLLIASAAIGCFVKSDFSILRFISSPLLLEFVFGILAAQIYKKQKDRTNKALSLVLLLSGAALMLTTLFVGTGKIYLAELVTSDNLQAFKRTVLWGVPCGIFIGGVVMTEKAFRYNTPTFLIKIGNASYSLYLIHFFIAQRINAHVSKSFARHPDLLILLIVVISTLTSLVIYHYIERPLTQKITTKMASVRNLGWQG